MGVVGTMCGGSAGTMCGGSAGTMCGGVVGTLWGGASTMWGYCVLFAPTIYLFKNSEFTTTAASLINSALDHVHYHW